MILMVIFFAIQGTNFLLWALWQEDEPSWLRVLMFLSAVMFYAACVLLLSGKLAYSPI